MMSRRRSALRWVSIGVGAAAAAYATYAGLAWSRYGHPPRGTEESHDPLLDSFMPAYDIVERHHIGVRAPAEVTFAAACDADLMQSRLAWTIFRAREVILGSEPDTSSRPRGVHPPASAPGPHRWEGFHR